jgi:UDP-3-O-[3-hydroxymyristoyl] N-acetylglucosamine deacetylase/3-hydroxyacyl-[acyl-carrier-protein] dehydratase
LKVNNNEPPILDDSAKTFAETLLKDGLKEFDAFRECYILKEPVHFEARKIRIFTCLLDQLEMECTIGFGYQFCGSGRCL